MIVEQVLKIHPLKLEICQPQGVVFSLLMFRQLQVEIPWKAIKVLQAQNVLAFSTITEIFYISKIILRIMSDVKEVIADFEPMWDAESKSVFSLSNF